MGFYKFRAKFGFDFCGFSVLVDFTSYFDVRKAFSLEFAVINSIRYLCQMCLFLND